ncbi:MAG: sugar phosphate isomerase/epimerase [Phycisphaeraceae bacterium]|nr:sugar phosphate isomerase/epimerase [Phycisphaeraceae bacterium]
MKYSVNLLLFGDVMTPAVLRQFPKLKAMGFDGVEVPVFEPEQVPYDRIRRQADRCGLAITLSGALPVGSRWYGRAAAPRKAAEKYLRGCIRAMRELDAPLICGPLYKPVGDMDLSMPLEQQRRDTARAMQPVLVEAAEAGKMFALEPLNRFETNLLNTAEQGVAFCARAQSPAAGLLLDTFHMHVEEKDSAQAVKMAAKAGVFAHFHASENDRGIAGTGQVAWSNVAAAVRASGYDQWCVLETFSQTVEAIRTAASCWRPFYPSANAFSREGLAFVRGRFGR